MNYVKDATVPILKIVFNQIHIDLLFASLDFNIVNSAHHGNLIKAIKDKSFFNNLG